MERLAEVKHAKSTAATPTKERVCMCVNVREVSENFCPSRCFHSCNRANRHRGRRSQFGAWGLIHRRRELLLCAYLRRRIALRVLSSLNIEDIILQRAQCCHRSRLSRPESKRRCCATTLFSRCLLPGIHSGRYALTKSTGITVNIMYSGLSQRIVIGRV